MTERNNSEKDTPEEFEIKGSSQKPEGADAGQEIEDEAAPPSDEQKGVSEVRQEAEGKTISVGEYEELKTLAQERDEYLKRLQRAVADYQNLSKRLDKIRPQMEAQAVTKTVERILPLADSFELAKQAIEQAEDRRHILQGVELIEKEFYAALESLRVYPIESVGEDFDPHYHDAVMRQPTEEVQPNTVVKEVKKGFMMGDQVLRAAQVIVAAPPEEGAADEDAS